MEKVENYHMYERYQKTQFPLHKTIEIWNNLDAEIVHVGAIHEFKAKLENSRYGDGTVQALTLCLCVAIR